MDILEALRPVHRVYQVCNLWHWHLNSHDGQLQHFRWLEIYSWTVLVAATSFAAYGLFDNTQLTKVMEVGTAASISNIGHTVDYIQLVGIRVAHAGALLETLWQRQAQQNFYTELHEIDHQFSKALNINVVNNQFRRCSIRRAMWMLAGYMLSQSFILVTKMLGSDHQFPIYWLYYLLPLLICGMRYYQIFTAVLIIRERLELLLQVLQTLRLSGSSDPFGVDSDIGKQCIATEMNMRAVSASSLNQLVAVRQLYQRLWTLATYLNRSHGLSMLLQVGNDFLAITSNCYWIFLNFRQFVASPYDFLQIVASIVWSAPHLGNVLILALICERTTHCATRLALSLHQINVDLHNESHNALITQFSLQLLHQRLRFSAAGFFNVDCTLLYTIVGATTTYLIILIQFHMSETNLENERSLNGD
ncbi:uncharacterized protein Dwil_GK16279 [Drosophila willistoni]|uniref:Gustatory receptor n=1 Tax=Drosophila willistoni TaxID=7260 RepID=B4N1K4_DROWI|nr:putative gustatory receptor 2a [Drosophila willistoni]EDW78243.1 uncharacterized protein Dwil_GK16279 [Drosophila willistoni]